MVSVEEVKAAISRAIADCEHAVNGTRAVRQEAADTLNVAHATTHDSGHRRVAEGLARLDEAGRETGRALRMLDASI